MLLSRAVCAAMLALIACSHAGVAERAAIKVYADTIKPIAEDGGRIVETGIKPGLSDLESGRVTPQTFRSQAAGWRREMTDVRARFAAVPAPPTLDRAKKLYDDSLAGYIRAIDAFIEASRKPHKQITPAVTAAIPIAERADKTYDAATAELHAEMKRVGLEVPSS